MTKADVFEWLEASALAEYIRQSHTLYPVIELVHIIGFVFLVGSAFLFDFRLLGISKTISVTSLASHLLPWSRRSLLLVLPTGLLLFTAEATTLGANRILGIKLTLILLAFTNAGYFHRYTFKTVSSWDYLQPTPVPAKAAAIISLFLWTGVLTCGRFLAYFE